MKSITERLTWNDLDPLLHGLAHEIEQTLDGIKVSIADIRHLHSERGTAGLHIWSENRHLMNIFIGDEGFYVYVRSGWNGLAHVYPKIIPFDEPNFKSLFDMIGKYAYG